MKELPFIKSFTQKLLSFYLRKTKITASLMLCEKRSKFKLFWAQNQTSTSGVWYGSTGLPAIKMRDSLLRLPGVGGHNQIVHNCKIGSRSFFRIMLQDIAWTMLKYYIQKKIHYLRHCWIRTVLLVYLYMCLKRLCKLDKMLGEIDF